MNDHDIRFGEPHPQCKCHSDTPPPPRAPFGSYAYARRYGLASLVGPGTSPSRPWEAVKPTHGETKRR